MQADLMIFAKGVTSGYLPLSGVMLTRRVHDVLTSVKGMFAHGFTYSGHPTACAVALRNLQILEEEGLVQRAAERGAYLSDSEAERRVGKVTTLHADVAQLVEHNLAKVGVAGSNPVVRSTAFSP